MKIRDFQIGGGQEQAIPLIHATSLTAQAGSAAASYEKAIGVAFVPSRNYGFRQVRLSPLSVLTGAANGAVGFLNLWRGGVQVSNDGLMGVMNFAAVGAPYAIAKFDQKVAAPNPGVLTLGKTYIWYGTIGAVTGASSTGATITALGSSSLTDGFITATSSIVVDPGTALEETVKLSALNTGTGVFTIAASGTFANSHPAGTIVAVMGGMLWQGKTAVITANSTTTANLTALGASSLTGLINNTYALVYEPGTANQEIIPAGQYTYTSGSGAVAPTSAYNGGKFAVSHAANVVVAIFPTNALPIGRKQAAGDTLTFKWLQGSTGLALPEGTIFVDYGV